MAKYMVHATLAGPFRAGTVVTDEQIKAVGGDAEFWKSHGAIKEVKGDEQPIAEDHPVLTDAAMKATIERRIREESLKTGAGAVQPSRQAQIVGEVQAEFAKANEKREADAAKRGKTTTPAPALTSTTVTPPAPQKPAPPPAQQK